MPEAWYLKLGFSENPFNIKPANLTYQIIKHDSAAITTKLADGQAVFIQAPFGNGKTTLMKAIISKFGGKKKLIYTSCVEEESIDVYGLLKNASLKGKIFGKLPQNMILLVDEAQDILQKDCETIESFLSKGNIKSAAFFGINYPSGKFTPVLENMLSGNIISLSSLTAEDAVSLIRTRIGKLKILPDYVIREIYSRFGINPRRLLQNCEDICRTAVELGIDELTVSDVSALLKFTEAELPAKKERKLRKPGNKIQKEQGLRAEENLSEQGTKEIQTAQAPLKKKAKKKTAKKNTAAKTAGTKHTKRKTENSELQIREPMHDAVTYSGYNLQRIRTYEEEMGYFEQPEK